MSGLSNAAMVVAANAIRTALRYGQLHTDDPGEGGAANKSTAAMVAPSWTTAVADGDFGLATDMLFTGGTPNGPTKYISFWSSNTAGATWYGNFALTGDLTFDNSGSYTVRSGDINFNGSSS